MGRAEESIVRREALTRLFKKIRTKTLRTVIITLAICVFGYITSITLEKPYPFNEPFFWMSFGLTTSLTIVLTAYIVVLKQESYAELKEGIRNDRAQRLKSNRLPSQLEVISDIEETEHLQRKDISVGTFVKGAKAS